MLLLLGELDVAVGSMLLRRSCDRKVLDPEIG